MAHQSQQRSAPMPPVSGPAFPMLEAMMAGYSGLIEMQKAMFGGMLAGPSTRSSALDRPTQMQVSEQGVIPITREELRVGKRQVRGTRAFRVSATVVEVPVEQQVNLRAETVVIERRPTRGTTVRGGQTFQDHTIEVHEMYEEPVVGKVVTQEEEVVIYKTLSERTATIRETVRQTEVNVEQHGGGSERGEVEHDRQGSVGSQGFGRPKELGGPQGGPQGSAGSDDRDDARRALAPPSETPSLTDRRPSGQEQPPVRPPNGGARPSEAKSAAKPS